MIRRFCTSLSRVVGALEGTSLQSSPLLVYAAECTQQPANLRSFAGVAWNTAVAHQQWISGTARCMSSSPPSDTPSSATETTTETTTTLNTAKPYVKRKKHKRRMELRAAQRREAHARRKQQLADVYERKRVRQQETWRWKSAAWAEYRSKQHAAAASGVEVIST